MTKINRYIQNDLQEAIKSVGYLLIAAERCSAKAEDILDLAITPENKFVLAKAAEIVNAPPTAATYVGVDLNTMLPTGVTFTGNNSQALWLQFAKPQAIMLPSMLTPPSNDALLAMPALGDWLRWRLKIGVTLGAVLSIIDSAYINEMTLEQLRYLIPGIVMLTKRWAGLNKYTERLQEFKAPSTLPKLSPAWRGILVELSELLGIAALLDPNGTYPAGSVTLSVGELMRVNHPTMGRIKLV